MRLRFFRGHGLHSPFVYGLYREAFMSFASRRRERERVLAYCLGRGFGVKCVEAGRKARRAAVEAHTSTSVSRRGMIYLFDDGLPKQHFRL